MKFAEIIIHRTLKNVYRKFMSNRVFLQKYCIHALIHFYALLYYFHSFFQIILIDYLVFCFTIACIILPLCKSRFCQLICQFIVFIAGMTLHLMKYNGKPQCLRF